MAVLLRAPGILALLEIGDAGRDLRYGYTVFLASDLVMPAVLVGVLYGFLGMFGGLLYLDRREDTFVIRVNRCSSLLSGVLASSILYFWLDGEALSTVQLVCAGIMMLALLIMALCDVRYGQLSSLQRICLFVCDSNRIRSPMAAAICNEEIAKRLGFGADFSQRYGILAESAGLKMPSERALHGQAKIALKSLSIPIPERRAKKINSYHVHRTQNILCMTDAQKRLLLSRFPWAAKKTISLDAEAEMHGQDVPDDVFIDVARGLQKKIVSLLDDSGLESEPSISFAESGG